MIISIDIYFIRKCLLLLFFSTFLSLPSQAKNIYLNDKSDLINNGFLWTDGTLTPLGEKLTNRIQIEKIYSLCCDDMNGNTYYLIPNSQAATALENVLMAGLVTPRSIKFPPPTQTEQAEEQAEEQVEEQTEEQAPTTPEPESTENKQNINDSIQLVEMKTEKESSEDKNDPPLPTTMSSTSAESTEHDQSTPYEVDTGQGIDTSECTSISTDKTEKNDAVGTETTGHQNSITIPPDSNPVIDPQAKKKRQKRKSKEKVSSDEKDILTLVQTPSQPQPQSIEQGQNTLVDPTPSPGSTVPPCQLPTEEQTPIVLETENTENQQSTGDAIKPVEVEIKKESTEDKKDSTLPTSMSSAFTKNTEQDQYTQHGSLSVSGEYTSSTESPTGEQANIITSSPSPIEEIENKQNKNMNEATVKLKEEEPKEKELDSTSTTKRDKQKHKKKKVKTNMVSSAPEYEKAATNIIPRTAIYTMLVEEPARICQRVVQNNYRRLRVALTNLFSSPLRKKFIKPLKFQQNNKALFSAKRTASSVSSRPFTSTAKGLVALLLLAGSTAGSYTAVTWFLNSRHKKTTGALSKISMLPAPEDNGREETREETREEASCHLLVSPITKKSCLHALQSGYTAAAHLIAIFGLLQQDSEDYPATAVYDTKHDNTVLESNDSLSEDCDGLEYGIIGFSARGKKTGNMPVFRHSDVQFSHALFTSSVLLASYIENTQLLEKLSFSLLQNALTWCGIPVNELSTKFHHQCIQWFARQFTEKGEDWYKDGLHHYYRTLFSAIPVQSEKANMGVTPVFTLPPSCHLEAFHYRPRLLEPLPQEKGYLSHPINEISISFLTKLSDQHLFIYGKHDLWTPTLFMKNFQQGAIYGLSHLSNSTPSTFFTIYNDQPIWAFSENRQKPPSHMHSQPRFHLITQNPQKIQPQSSQVTRLNSDPAFKYRLPSMTLSLLMAGFLGHIDGKITTKGTDIAWVVLASYLFWEFAAPPAYVTQPENPATNRLHNLYGLVEYFLKNQSYLEANLLQALLLDQDLPLGTISYTQIYSKLKQPEEYIPLSTLPLEKQIQLFSKATDSCSKHYANCRHSIREHLEYVRFQLSNCNTLTSKQCWEMWKNPSSRTAWDTLVNALDWPEKKTLLRLNSPPPESYISYPVLKKINKNWLLFIEIQAPDDKSLDHQKFSILSVAGAYDCHLEQNKKYKKIPCLNDGKRTFFDNLITGMLILKSIPGNDQPSHLVYFQNNKLIKPYWNRQATWQQHIQPAHFTTDLCNNIVANNLRLLCLESRTEEERRETIELSRRIEPDEHVPIFSHFVSSNAEFTSIKHNGLIKFNQLSIDRLRQHFKILKHPLFQNISAESGVTLLKLTGVLYDIPIEYAENIYREKMYTAIGSDMAHIHSAKSSCFQKHIQQGDMIKEQMPFLYMSPSWLKINDDLIFSFEPVYGNLPPHTEKGIESEPITVTLEEKIISGTYLYSDFSRATKTIHNQATINAKKTEPLKLLINDQYVVHELENLDTQSYYIALRYHLGAISTQCISGQIKTTLHSH